jgi:hypothetical protein
MDVAGFWNNVGINLEHRKFSNQEMAHVHISVRHHNNIHLLQYKKSIVSKLSSGWKFST